MLQSLWKDLGRCFQVKKGEALGFWGNFQGKVDVLLASKNPDHQTSGLPFAWLNVARGRSCAQSVQALVLLSVGWFFSG